MPADVIDELQELGTTLRALAPTIVRDELRRQRVPTEQPRDLEPVTSLPIHRPGLRPPARTRLVGAAAAVGLIVAAAIGIALLDRQPASDTVPGSPSDSTGEPSATAASDSFVESTAPMTTLLPPEELLAPGATLRVSKQIPGFAVLQYSDTADGSQVCLFATFVDGSLSNGCDELATIQSGQGYNLMDYDGRDRVLFGLTAIDIGFRADVGGTTVTADDDGFWWTVLPRDVLEFTITTDAGSKIIPIADVSIAGPQTTITFDSGCDGAMTNMPDLVGQPPGSIVAALERNCTIALSVSYADSGPGVDDDWQAPDNSNSIIDAQEPAPGTPLAPGAQVVLHVTANLPDASTTTESASTAGDS